MHCTTWKLTIAAGLMIGSFTGCSTLNHETVRAQSQDAQLLVHEQDEYTQAEIEQIRGRMRPARRYQGETVGALENQLRSSEVTHHNYRTAGDAGQCPDGSCYQNGMPGMYGNYGADPHARWGTFNQYPCPSGPYAGFSKCPPSHQEQCWDHGGRRHRGFYHYHTYSYKEPKNLVYPCPNQPGGVVTYPYYTHKGPSDFFWKGDSDY